MSLLFTIPVKIYRYVNLLKTKDCLGLELNFLKKLILLPD